MKKILVVTQYFWPENFRINDFCLGLVENGYQVDVLTAYPNYPDGDFFKDYSSQNRKTEVWNDITIHRCKIFPRKKNKLSLILNYLSFPITASLKARRLKRNNYDVVLSMNYSPIFSCIPGVYAKNSKSNSLLWVQDLWPESLIATNTINNKFVITLISKLTKWIYKHNDKILVQSKAFIPYLIDQGVVEEKIKYLPNHIENIFENNKSKSELLKNISKPIVLFAGNIGVAQNLKIAVKAAHKLNENNHKINWVIVGNGREKENIENLAKDYNLTNFIFLGSFPMEKMPELYNGSDLLFASLRDEKIFEYTIPNKIQSYLASGKPILAAIKGEGAKIINVSNSGLVCLPNDVNSLYNSIVEFLKLTEEEKIKLGSNGLNYFNNEFHRNIILKKAMMFFEDQKNE